MTIDIEPINGYLIRLYNKPNDTKYSGTITLTNRGNGEYELVGWVRPKNVETGYHYKLMKEIEDKLNELLPDFKYITGTFDIKSIKAQERLWRKYYQLIPIKKISKEYNGTILNAVYVKFKRIK